MSKYNLLWKYIKEEFDKSNKEDKDCKEIKLSFEQIKEILGFEIDHSFLTYKKELIEYGYEVKKISMKEKTVLFIKK